MDLNLLLLYLLSTLCILVKTVICHSCGTRNDFLKKHPVKHIKILSTKDLVSKNPTGLVISMFSSDYYTWYLLWKKS